jgi:hypothetical protein
LEGVALRVTGTVPLPLGDPSTQRSMNRVVAQQELERQNFRVRGSGGDAVFRPAARWLRPPFPVTVRLTQGIMTPDDGARGCERRECRNSEIAGARSDKTLPSPAILFERVLQRDVGRSAGPSTGRRCEGLVRGIAKPNDNVRCLAGTPWHEGPLAVWGGVGLVKLFYAPETARGTCALMGPGTGRGVPKVLADRQYRARR